MLSAAVSVYQVSLWLIAPKNFWGKIRQYENLLVKRLVYVSYYTLWHYRLSMYFSSHASLLVYLIACAFGLLCFIRCFLVKLYILFNHLINCPTILMVNKDVYIIWAYIVWIKEKWVRTTLRSWPERQPLRSRVIRRQTVQDLADLIVEVGLPRPASPAHAVLEGFRTLVDQQGLERFKLLQLTTPLYLSKPHTGTNCVPQTPP